LLLTAALTLIVTFGFLTVRSAVEAAAGRPFEDLSPQEVRSLTVEGEARHVGLGNVAFLMAPILAAAGLVLARLHRAGLIILFLGLAASTLLPGRLLALTSVGLIVMFYYYSRHLLLGPRPRQLISREVAFAVGAVVAIAAGGLYFSYQGERLGKSNYLVEQVGPTPLPSQLVPLAVYLTASPATLSSAFENLLDPIGDERYRTAWLVKRLQAVANPDTKVPNTVAGFVPIPFSFNTYTWMGDIYFDFGWVGLLIVGVLTGVIVTRVDLWARRAASLSSAWVAATVVVMFLSGIVEFRFLWLEAWLWPIAGGMLFAFVQRPSSAAA
jgi:oligosaccharide repeat unit polymerase